VRRGRPEGVKEFAESDLQMEMPFNIKRMAYGGFTVIVGS
jgi:uncharacterized protein YbaA (DUF1428 family)